MKVQKAEMSNGCIRFLLESCCTFNKAVSLFQAVDRLKAGALAAEAVAAALVELEVSYYGSRFYYKKLTVMNSVFSNNMICID